MTSSSLEALLGSVQVMTTNGRGFSAEELTERALNQLIHIGDNAPPGIREQAIAFRGQIGEVLIYFMREAMRSRNVTLTAKLVQAGCPELVKLLDD